jgi:hypothetical protein
VVLTVNGLGVSSPETFASAVKGKERVVVRVEREGNYFFAALRQAEASSH